MLSQSIKLFRTVKLCNTQINLKFRNQLNFRYCHDKSQSHVDLKNVETPRIVSKQMSKSDVYETIFKYPLIKYVRLISRFKVYQLAFMGIFMFPIYSSYTEGAISKLTLYSALGGCAGVSLAFIIFSYFSTKFVGQLSINEERDMLQIARLTFYGSKKYDYVKVEDIVPWGDRNTDIDKFMQRLYIINEADSEQVYIYSLKFGMISNAELFSDVFGLQLD